jgi:hypothetical protein
LATPAAASDPDSERGWRRYPALVDAVENPPATMFGSLPVSRPLYVVASLATSVTLLVSGFSLLLVFHGLPIGIAKMFIQLQDSTAGLR